MLLTELDGSSRQRQRAGEFYLADTVAMTVAEGIEIHSVGAVDRHEVMGGNDRLQLAELERQCQRAQAEQLMREGFTLRDPARFDLRGSQSVGRDVEIKKSSVGQNSKINHLSYVGDINVGKSMNIGAGSTITCGTPADALTLSRVKQTSHEGWKCPVKQSNPKD